MGQSGYTCVRYIFCYLNIIIWLSSCGLLGIGAWLYFSQVRYKTLVPQYSLVSADWLLIVLGSVFFIVTFFGCCGSWFQSRCMLVTYFSLVIVLFMIEFMFATLAFMFRQDISHTLNNELLLGIEQHYMNPQDNGLDGMWDEIHNQFHCCGVSNYEDWFDIKAWPGQKYVPNSCCIPKYQNITDCGKPMDEDHYNPDMWYQKGCAEQVHIWLVKRLHVVGIVGLVVSFIQLFGLISSMLLFCTVRHKRTSHTYRSYDTTS
uniref:Tetraspanin n=1 Tax=Clastoptera arizonana TaxID=38151 RepID=A0A1B6C1Q1_9HEMI